MPIVVEHGHITGIAGHPRKSNGIWFAAVSGEIDDPEECASHPCHNFIPLNISWDGDFFDDDGGELADGPWARAAIPPVFGFTPLHIADGRWFLLDALFVAVHLDNEGCGMATLFACTDSGLLFSRSGPTEAARNQIARAFWRLMFRKGAGCLSPFVAERIAFAHGDGYDAEMEYGYARERFYAVDSGNPNVT